MAIQELEEGTMPNVEGLKKLREPFPDHQVSKLPKGTKAQNECPASEKRNCAVCGGWHHPKVVHLDYVGHAAITDRLLDADPAWEWEPMAVGPDRLPLFDASGGLWIRLTVCGVSRLGYGHAQGKQHMDIGAREKEVIGDALRNAGMRFGMALELWHKGDLHADKEETSVVGYVAPSQQAVVAASQAEAEVVMSLTPTPQDEALALLARFEEAKTLAEVDEINELFNKAWTRLKGVKGLRDSIVAVRTNARGRIKKGGA